MSPEAIVLVLVSAVLHTTWNAAIKHVTEKRTFAAVIVKWAAVFAAVPALWQVAHGAPITWEAVGLATATSLSWLLYYEWLAISYVRGDLSVAYPVIRGVAPVAALFLGLAMGELPTGLGLLGVGMVVVGVWLISLPDGANRSAFRVRNAVGIGVLSAIYSAIDKRGVTVADPAIYYFGCLFLAAIWLALASRWREGPEALRRVEREHQWLGIASGLGDFASHGLVLLALRLAPLMYVVPLRATAVLISVVVGAVVMKEPQMRRRLAFGLLIVAGITLIGLKG